MISKPGKPAKFTSVITSHPNWVEEFDTHHARYMDRHTKTRNQANLRSLVDVADDIGFKHSGMHKERLVEAISYCVTRDILSSADPDVFDSYHDDKALIPTFKAPEVSQSTGGKHTNKRRKTTSSKSRT